MWYFRHHFNCDLTLGCTRRPRELWAAAGEPQRWADGTTRWKAVDQAIVAALIGRSGNRHDDHRQPRVNSDVVRLWRGETHEAEVPEARRERRWINRNRAVLASAVARRYVSQLGIQL